ncbi:DUF2460 domain-containing protein [Acinetobacter baumannii]|uniref:Uncharacterized protein n=1 Tax=Acinetobacter baumannii TaxID=470 RepID=A0A335FMQ1_ACIBA|nr:DUF2460 domain-containing protein [Acinetobacter baumannii]SST19961.1 Uncharacterised protein [Acinetobacter baumannii]
MAVPEQTPFIEYTANGTTTVYPLTFDCDKSEYLIVSLDGEEAPVGSWTLTGGSITFNSAPANGVLITIERNTPFRRTTEYQSYNNSFRPSPVNKDFDLIWWKLQELGYRDQVIWLALVKEIADRIAGDDNLQNQINTIDEWLANLQQNVNENTNDIAQLVTDLSKEIADRIANDEALKEMFLAMMDEAINEGTINALAITHVECIADLINITNVWDGRTVYVKSVLKPIYEVALPFIAGGNFVYKASSTMQADGFLVVNAPNGRWIKALDESEITVDDFGGIGDNTKDNSDAFNAYASSPHVGMEIKLGKQGRYRVAKQVDLQGKNLVGSGMGKPNDKYYNLSSIDVDGSSPDLQGKTAFINCGPTIQNVTARCSNGAGKQVSFVEIDGYLANISYVTIVNFYNQIVVKEALVGFNINNAWLYYSQNAGIYCEDPNNRVSTTGTFHNMYFQLGDGYAMIFDRDIHGSDFDNIIFESMNGGIKARTVAHCGFGKFWCENLKTATSKDWLEVTGANSCYGNSFTGYVKLLGGWTSKTSPILDSLSTNNYGGVSVSADGISIVAAGNKAKMLMLPSGFKTGNAVIDETHINSTTVTPLTKRRVIGADASGAQYLASDTYTKLSRKWSTYNHGSNNAGAFYAPMMLTYDQSFSTPQNNNGWQIVKESTGVYRIERVSGNISVITNGHILVGSPLMGSRLGTGSGATHGLQMIETYAGSWTSYAEAAGFKVFWRDSTGALVDPYRFTVAFTATS